MIVNGRSLGTHEIANEKRGPVMAIHFTAPGSDPDTVRRAGAGAQAREAAAWRPA